MGPSCGNQKRGKCEILRQILLCPYLLLIGLISNVLNGFIPGLDARDGYQNQTQTKQ